MRVLPLHSFDPLVVYWHALLAADLIRSVFLLLSFCEQTPRDASEVKVTKGRSCGEKVFGNVSPFCRKIPAIFLLSFRVFCMSACLHCCHSAGATKRSSSVPFPPFLPPSHVAWWCSGHPSPRLSLILLPKARAMSLHLGAITHTRAHRTTMGVCTYTTAHIVLLLCVTHTHRHMRYARLLTLNTT